MTILNESQPSRPVGRWLAIGMLGVGASLGATGCTAAAGAGVAAVAVGAAIATSECYGYVDVLVTDGATGSRACDANVSAARGEDVVPFTSCFYAPLTEGRWKLAVEKPGYQSVTSEIQVDPQEHCERVVHYISVRLDSLSAPPPKAWELAPAAPAAPPAPALVPITTPPPPAAPAGPMPPASEPTVPGAAPSAAPTTPTPAPPIAPAGPTPSAPSPAPAAPSAAPSTPSTPSPPPAPAPPAPPATPPQGSPTP
ncbi:MAG TPA: hypothetical protein VI197_26415 [Polyangiaceae bacterium]